MRRFMLRGHDVSVETGLVQRINVYVKDRPEPQKAEKLMIQILMYLDAEGMLDLSTQEKPQADFIVKTDEEPYQFA